jgi:hypothetical protein
MFDIVEFHSTDTEPLGFLLLCAALLNACIAHRFAPVPTFAGVRTYLAFAFAE